MDLNTRDLHICVSFTFDDSQQGLIDSLDCSHHFTLIYAVLYILEINLSFTLYCSFSTDDNMPGLVTVNSLLDKILVSNMHQSSFPLVCSEMLLRVYRKYHSNHINTIKNNGTPTGILW